MGVEYRGVLCAGYDHDEFVTILNNCNYQGDKDDLVEAAEFLGLSVYHPYYDSPLEDAFFGTAIVESNVFSAARVNSYKLELINMLIEDLHKEFGLTPDIYIMAAGD